MKSRFDTLPEWLHWQETLHRQKIDLGVERVRSVAERMNLLHPPARVVSVAGTNGKGSCVAFMEALLLQCGVSVGSFTSPHFNRYNERIRLNGCEVGDGDVCRSFARIDAARDDTTLTYFEFGTLAALDIFSSAEVDVMLLEVGLGGRLDAVNIIDADVAVVTSIALDHSDWLGDDLTTIGAEKAGIFRSRRWAICADAEAPASVAQVARDTGANWLCMGADFQVSAGNDSRHWCWRGVDERRRVRQLRDLPLPNLPLPSVAAAMQAVCLLGYPLTPELVIAVMTTRLRGRAELIRRRGIDCILDVAHNPAAARYLARYLSRNQARDHASNSSTLHPGASPGCGRTVCLSAVMADKDRRGIFEALLPVVDCWHVAGLPGVARAAAPETLAGDLAELQRSAIVHTCLGDALTQLLQELAAGDRLVVMGSFYSVAEAHRVFEELGCDQGVNCG